MFVSEETMKSHMRSLFQKLGMHDQAKAGSSLRRGIIRL